MIDPDKISPKMISDIKETMLAAIDAAAAETLPLFRSTLIVDNKLSDGFDPVTAADRNAELAIREIINVRFPEHSIIGEEAENKDTDSAYTWIIDPIDGTRAYISGVPVWGTLIGVTHHGKAIAGVMSQPFTGETYLASDGNAVLMHNGAQTDLQVRSTKKLQDAVLFTTAPALFDTPALRKAYDSVEVETKLARYSCDCYAYALLAAGQIDVIIEPGMNSYDIAALVPIIENAGGIVRTWDGNRAEGGGNIIAACTEELCDATLEIMERHLSSIVR